MNTYDFDAASQALRLVARKYNARAPALHPSSTNPTSRPKKNALLYRGVADLPGEIQEQIIDAIITQSLDPDARVVLSSQTPIYAVLKASRRAGEQVLARIRRHYTATAIVFNLDFDRPLHSDVVAELLSLETTIVVHVKVTIPPEPPRHGGMIRPDSVVLQAGDQLLTEALIHRETCAAPVTRHASLLFRAMAQGLRKAVCERRGGLSSTQYVLPSCLRVDFCSYTCFCGRQSLRHEVHRTFKPLGKVLSLPTKEGRFRFMQHEVEQEEKTRVEYTSQHLQQKLMMEADVPLVGFW